MDNAAKGCEGGVMSNEQIGTQDIWTYIESLLEDEPSMLSLFRTEVERVNIAHREANGEAVGRMAAMSVMGSTIEELERENAELRAELARIKPSWDDAPDNAKYLAQDADWSWDFHECEPRPLERDETEDTPFWGSHGWCNVVHSKHWRETLERRPEET